MNKQSNKIVFDISRIVPLTLNSMHVVVFVKCFGGGGGLLITFM